jgi:cell division protein FtsI (penicillin-binding protein 3)
LNHHFFVSLATQQYQVIVTQPPARAPIFDRTGTHYLACNKECLSAFVMPNQLHNAPALFAFLEQYFPQAISHIQSHAHANFSYIKRRLCDEEIACIKQAQLADIHLVCETNRFYPLPSAAPLIGFTDIDNMGQAGVELACNAQLMGSASTVCLEKDARSGYFYFHKELQHEGTKSMPIHLTIDANLQFLVDEEVAQALTRYQAKEAAAVIMDPTTGEILAMASHPFSDPNHPPFVLDTMKPCPVTDSYELGSVIKVAAAIAALEEGVVTPDELIDCKNSKTGIIDGRTINTIKACGIIPFYDVIVFSNNIGIAQVAKRLGYTLYDHYLKMGFGAKTGIPLPAENKGFVNHPSNWSKQSIISLSYGYEIRATLLQLGCLFCMIANDGTYIQPKLLMDQKTKSWPCYSASTMQIIKDMLRKTTQYGSGARAAITGYDVMIKTGTANLLDNGSYRKTNDLLTCAGIIAKDGYKRVIITFIKEATIPNAYAATIAVPLFRHIAEKMIIHERAI